MTENKSTIRVRVIVLIVIILFIAIADMYIDYENAFMHLGAFVLIGMLGFVVWKQSCEKCGLSWWEYNYPVEEGKTSILDTWKRDYYPSPFTIPNDCPKCGNPRL